MHPLISLERQNNVHTADFLQLSKYDYCRVVRATRIIEVERDVSEPPIVTRTVLRLNLSGSDYTLLVDEQWYNTNLPKDGDWLVITEDGYAFACANERFIEAYSSKD